VLLKHIASRLKLTGDLWPAYLSGRDTTRREHLTELHRYLGVEAFTGKIQQDCITHLLSMSTRTDKGILLAEELLIYLRQNNVIIPVIDVVERTRPSGRPVPPLICPVRSITDDIRNCMVLIPAVASTAAR